MASFKGVVRYNNVFTLDFLNYLLRLNLALTGTALWIHLRDKARPPNGGGESTFRRFLRRNRTFVDCGSRRSAARLEPCSRRPSSRGSQCETWLG